MWISTQDQEGRFIRERIHIFAGLVPVVEAEAAGVLEAIRSIKSLDMQNVNIESDSLLTVQAINSAIDNYLEVGVIIQECRSVLDTYSDILVSSV
ncbi:hypothetical protein AgCh_003530 [Apium graveolens]